MAITASLLQKIQGRARDMWLAGNMKTRYNPEVDVMRAIWASQGGVQIDNSLTSRDKDTTARIVWPNLCGYTVDDCGNLCEWTGVEVTTDAKDYTIGYCRELTMKIAHDAWRSNEFGTAELVAEWFMRADMELSEDIAQTGVAKLEAFAGRLPWFGPTEWAWDGTTTPGLVTVAADQFGSTLFMRMRQAARRAKLSMPVVVSGDIMLEEAQYIASTNQANGEGKGEAARWNELQSVYFDTVNIPDVTDSTTRTYLMEPGAIAFVTKNRYAPAPETIVGPAARIRYSRRSNILPFVVYDVETTTDCDETALSSAGDLFDFFKIRARFDFFQNPVGCEDQYRTGIYKFDREAAV